MYYTIRLLFAILGLAGFGYIVYEFMVSYLDASGTRSMRAWIPFRASVTIIWARFVAAVSLLILGIVNLTAYLNFPEVSNAISLYLTPTSVALLAAGIAIVTEVARNRSL